MLRSPITIGSQNGIVISKNTIAASSTMKALSPF